MQPDRHRLRQQLRALEQTSRSGKDYEIRLVRFQEELARSIELRSKRMRGLPQVRYDDELPIAARRDEIAEAIRAHQVVVVCGETGSGKSTQLPKICLELGRGVDGLIGHTQPRRIAARSVAARIAEELRVSLGREVGFKIRFTDSTSPQTYVKLMTDGILLAESQADRFLDQYDTIIIDEAHERSLNIDFLLGYLTRLLPRRRDLRLIITSATIDAARFSQHFSAAGRPAPVIEVSGRTYPVELRYRPMLPDEEGNEPDLQDAVRAAVDEVASIDQGDILIFMPTEQDIHETAKTLRGHAIPGDYGAKKTQIVPLYARLSSAEQQRVFQPHPHRRIVIATNVAESSLTVPGIRYVIDPGTARISRYAARSKIQRLPIEPISQASADQRKGRCGRVGPGICLRLFSEADYLARERFISPEIQRSNLAAVILQAKALRFGEIEEFPFLDPPRPEAIRDGYKTLFELGAIDDQQELTELGRQISKLPTDPRIARIILAGNAENCLHEVLILAAALEVQEPRERPFDKQQAADAAHAKFAHEESDFLSYLKLWDFYHHLKAELSRSQLEKACRQNFLSYNRLREWLDVHRQLLGLVEQAGLKQQSRRDDYTAIHRALLTGLLSNVAYHSDQHEYTVAGGSKAHLWPGSATFAKKPQWIVAAEQVETNRRYLRTAAAIQPGWIESLAGHLVQRSYSEPHWLARSLSAMAYERVSLFGLVVVPRRRVPFGPIDPDRSRELLIQHGLVQGEWDRPAPFLQHNLQLVKELESLEKKARRPGLLLGEEARVEFYDRRIPADIVDGARFEKWRRSAEKREPRLLYMSQDDLLVDEAALVTTADFPESMAIRHLQVPLVYHFEPGAEQDGITLTIPPEGLNQLDPQRLGWLVPGLLEEKVTALIKSLPKSLRVQFVPAPDTARKVVAQLRFGEGNLAAGVAAALSRIGGAHVPIEAFQLESLPEHLRMNVRVVDSQGKPLAEGRDLLQLRQQLGAQASARIAEADDPTWRRDGIQSWDLGDLPERVEVHRGGLLLHGYPALVDRGDAVSLRLTDTPEKWRQTMHDGVRRLCAIGARRELKSQALWLPGFDQMALYASRRLTSADLKQHLADLIAERAFMQQVELPRRAAEFQRLFQAGQQRIGLAVQAVAALMTPLWQAYHQAELAIERLRDPRAKYVVDDLNEQLSQLVIAGFLTATPWSWLQQFPRYFKAISLRIDKLSSGGLAKDRANYELLAPRWRMCLDRAKVNAERGLLDPQLVQYRWMLEEYRVSLFAQKLGTSLSVSEKRLDEQWAKTQSPGVR